MNISGQVVPGGNTVLRQVAAQLSREARRRLQWMDFYARHGRNARLTCRHFGISPDVFYRWQRRYDPRRLESLEDDRRTRRPRRVLRRLKARRLVREPRRAHRRRGWQPRPHAQRLPPGYPVRAPGDLVQVDTLDIEVLPGVRRKQFTARDMVSRYDVVEAYGRATAHTATAFLALLVQRMPISIRALQIDGGSEFKGAFEAAGAALHLPLFVVPPHSPKLQSHVERAQRTHREEFYEVWEVDLQLEAHRARLQAWVHIYNTVRPHQHLNYLTPLEYCERHNQRKG